jgi:hypothetical protein
MSITGLRTTLMKRHPTIQMNNYQNSKINNTETDQPDHTTRSNEKSKRQQNDKKTFYVTKRQTNERTELKTPTDR